MKTRLLSGCLALLASLTVGTVVSAQQFQSAVDDPDMDFAEGSFENPQLANRGGPGFSAHSSLSEEQLSKLRALKNQLTLDTASKRAQLKVSQSQMREHMGKAIVDKQQVLALQAKINGLRSELSDARLNFMLSASDVLTPEQRAQMRKRMLSRSFMGGPKRHAGGDCGGFKRSGHRFRSSGFQRPVKIEGPTSSTQSST